MPRLRNKELLSGYVFFLELKSCQWGDEFWCGSNQRPNSPSLCVSMDDVPLKIPMVSSQAVEEDVEITVPDYLSILQETEVNIPTHFPHTYNNPHNVFSFSSSNVVKIGEVSALQYSPIWEILSQSLELVTSNQPLLAVITGTRCPLELHITPAHHSGGIISHYYCQHCFSTVIYIFLLALGLGFDFQKVD